MPDSTPTTAVGRLPETTTPTSRLPALLTRTVWALWVASLLALVARLGFDWSLTLPGVLAVDGLTVVLWVGVTFFAGVVHSYARRYMAGTHELDRFFGRVFGFTLAVCLLVAADHLALFAGAWLAMGLLMADLVGHVRTWPQARAAGRLARRSFLASGALLSLGLVALWWATGATTVSGALAALDGAPTAAWFAAALALLFAAVLQSALVPFHGWLLSSMTAPTPASALMHAGFVNAGGILLARFAPVFTADASLLTLVLVVGATSALVGKLLKSVQPNAKRQLGASTVAQMGFMFVQAGLGFVAAAVTHLLLHGCYKAYLFLSVGEQVERTAPVDHGRRRVTPTGALVALVTAVLAGGLFVALTGTGTALGGGLLLVLFVVLTTVHAARDVAAHADLPAGFRYGAVPLLVLVAVALYAGIYGVVTAATADLPGLATAVPITAAHLLVAGTFLVAYVVVDLGLHRRSTRLYVALTNYSGAAPATLLTNREEYREY
jgi:NAD(P)H-quinone oxidoreductase subunit 5